MARYALRESVRRRVISVVLVLSVLFLALYWLGAQVAFDEVERFGDVDAQFDEQVLTGSTLFGLSMFTTLFLGAVLAAFLTLGSVAATPSAALQPLVVRPVGRSSLLLGRFLGAVAVCGVYAWRGCTWRRLLITGATGGWWPDRIVAPGLGARGRGDRDRRAVAARLRLPVRHRQRDRGAHALRRARRGAARADRRRPSGRRSRTWPPSAPGSCPSRRSTRRGSTRSPRTWAASPASVQLGPFGGAARAGRRCGCGPSPTSPRGLAARAAFARRDL